MSPDQMQNKYKTPVFPRQYFNADQFCTRMLCFLEYAGCVVLSIQQMLMRIGEKK